MDATATRHDTTEGDTILTVADAAVVFGISEGAIRKRIERGQISARKIRGQWRVIVNTTDATRHDTTECDNATRQNAPQATRPVVSDGPRAQLDAVMSEWLLPLMQQIAEQAEQIGEQRVRIEQLENERNIALTEATTLRARFDAVDLPGEGSVGHGTKSAPERTYEHQRRSWMHRLLFGSYEADGMPKARI